MIPKDICSLVMFHLLLCNALIQAITDNTATSLGFLSTVATKQLALLVHSVRQKAVSSKLHAKKRVGIIES